MLPFKKTSARPAGTVQLSGDATLLGGARKECIDVACGILRHAPMFALRPLSEAIRRLSRHRRMTELGS
jgi:hypothetical protein